MVKKRFVITDDNEVSFQENDRVVSVYPGSEPDEGPHVVIEREVPDEPAHKPGTKGVATVENPYGVAIPDKEGMWVKRGDGSWFTLTSAKAGSRAMYPASMVSDFVPDPTPAETFEALTRDVNKAVRETRKWRRKHDNVDTALRDLIADLRCIQQDMGRTSSMRTAAGATLLRWLQRKEESCPVCSQESAKS